MLAIVYYFSPVLGALTSSRSWDKFKEKFRVNHKL
jgi:hypothetical protein